MSAPSPPSRPLSTLRGRRAQFRFAVVCVQRLKQPCLRTGSAAPDSRGDSGSPPGAGFLSERTSGHRETGRASSRHRETGRASSRLGTAPLERARRFRTPASRPSVPAEASRCARRSREPPDELHEWYVISMLHKSNAQHIAAPPSAHLQGANPTGCRVPSPGSSARPAARRWAAAGCAAARGRRIQGGSHAAPPRPRRGRRRARGTYSAARQGRPGRGARAAARPQRSIFESISDVQGGRASRVPSRPRGARRSDAGAAPRRRAGPVLRWRLVPPGTSESRRGRALPEAPAHAAGLVAATAARGEARSCSGTARVPPPPSLRLPDAGLGLEFVSAASCRPAAALRAVRAARPPCAGPPAGARRAETPPPPPSSSGPCPAPPPTRLPGSGSRRGARKSGARPSAQARAPGPCRSDIGSDRAGDATA